MFNVRDLMLNLSAAGAQQAIVGVGCHVCTGTCCDTGWGSGCWGSCGWSGCGRFSPVYEVAAAIDPEAEKQQLSTLKEQLKRAVAEIEKQEATHGKK